MNYTTDSPADMWLYPLVDNLDRMRLEGTNYYRVERLIDNLRFRRFETDRRFEGDFNYRTLTKINQRVRQHEDLYHLHVHPYIQKKFDHWDSERQRIRKIKNLYYLDAADEFYQDYSKSDLQWSFQGVDSKFAVEAQNALILDDPGLGKTIIAAAAFDVLRRTKQIKKTLVICPSAVSTNWKDELLRWAPTFPQQLNEVTGQRESQQIVVANDHYTTADRLPGILLILHTDMESILIVNWETIRLPVIGQMIQDMAWDLVIADEAHRARNIRASKQAKAFQEIHGTYQWALTGTAIVNYPEDLFALVHWLYPTQYPDYDVFSEDFVDEARRKVRMAKKYSEANDQEKSKLIVEKIDLELDFLMTKRDKRQIIVCQECKYVGNKYRIDETKCPRCYGIKIREFLKEPRKEKIRVDLYPKQRAIYEKMRDNLIMMLESGELVEAPNRLTEIARLKQIALSPAVIPATKELKTGLTSDTLKMDISAKFDWIINYIQEQLEDEKLVIFSQYESSIKLLEHRTLQLNSYKNQELGYVYACNPTRRYVNYKQIQKYRDVKILETAFQQDPNVRLWEGTLKTGGEGITLTAAHRLIRTDKWWNRAAHDQGDARIDRGGQTEVPILMELEAADTIEQWINELIDEKNMQMNDVMSVDTLVEILRKDRKRSKQLREEAC